MEEYQGLKVGVAADVKGEATVIRADGTTSVVQKGTVIYENDTVETSEEGAVNISFNDGTSFAISQNASMVIDEFVYDPSQKGEGDLDITVARGVFGYTSGLIGKEDPQDVNIETPVGSIGIRGTTFTASIPPEGSGEQFKVSILEGAIAVQPKNGGEYILDDALESLEINPVTFAVTEMGTLSPDAVMQSFNVINTVAPNIMAPALVIQQDQINSADPSQAESIIEGGVNGANEAEPGQGVEDQGTEASEAVQEDAGVVVEDDITVEDELNLENEDLTSSGDDLLANETEIVVQDSLGGINDITDQTDVSDSTDITSSSTFNDSGVTDSFNPSTSGSVTSLNINNAPVTTAGVHFVGEIVGLEGGSHSFNVSRYFSDPDGDALSYSVSTSVPSALSISPGVVNNDLYFDVANPLAADMIVTFTVTASDGEFFVSKDFDVGFFQSNITVSPSPSSGADSFIINGAGFERLSGLGGDDNFTVTSDFNDLLGENGNDTFVINGNNNEAFGELGDDALTINSGINHTISGGDGRDTLSVIGSGFQNFLVFGGNGQDLIRLDSNALTELQAVANSSAIDGGTGVDTLFFTEIGGIDLTVVDNQDIMDIEAINLNNGLANVLEIDINDVFSYSGDNLLIINGDVSDIVALHGTSLAPGILGADQTGLSNPIDTGDFNTYDTYSFINAAGETTTLYIADTVSQVNAV